MVAEVIYTIFKCLLNECLIFLSYMKSWGPRSMNSGAIGGSEEAVIQISEELAALGY